MPSADFVASKEMENLVLEIKENLRLSGSLKAPHTAHLSRKSSRASPYRLPGAREECRRKAQQPPDDPYELLQRLLRDGGLVSEAVRRLQRGLSPKQRYFYESEEEH